MKTTLLIALIVVLASSQCPDWQEFKARYGRVYPNLQAENIAKAKFLENCVKITEHNADPSSTYTMSVNEFSDKTLEEQLSIHNFIQVLLAFLDH